MKLTLMIIGGVWTGIALLFVLGLCRAAKRQAAKPARIRMSGAGQPNRRRSKDVNRCATALLSINRQEVRNAGDASQLTQNPKDKRTLLRVWSNSGSHFILIED